MKTHARSIEGIEALRGVAALMILLYHSVELLKVPLPAWLNVVRTHFGLGVPLFYALSGFVLAYGYAGSLTSTQEIRSFYLRRFFRIAPLFYFMLITWLIVNALVWNSYSSPQTVFLNFSFLFGLVPGLHISIVWAGWSIGIEMLFYLVFPIVAFFTRSIVAASTALMLSLVLSGATYTALTDINAGNYAYMNLITHLPNFLVGVVVYRVWQNFDFQRSKSGRMLFIIAIALAYVLIKKPEVTRYLASLDLGFLQRNVWIVVFGTLILSVCMWQNPILIKGPLRRLGAQSLSLYLLHPLIMLGLMQIGFAEKLKTLTNSTTLQFIAGVTVTTCLVWVVSSFTYRYIELPGIMIGKNLTRPSEPIVVADSIPAVASVLH